MSGLIMIFQLSALTDSGGRCPSAIRTRPAVAPTYPISEMLTKECEGAVSGEVYRRPSHPQLEGHSQECAREQVPGSDHRRYHECRGITICRYVRRCDGVPISRL